MYLDKDNALFLYFVVRIRRRRKKFTFAISSADEFLVSCSQSQRGKIFTKIRSVVYKVANRQQTYIQTRNRS